jgi:hypothetical protein
MVFQGDVRVHFYRELELAVGETIILQNRTLTLLDTEDGLGLFQLDADDQYCPIASEEFWELLETNCEIPCSPR